MPGTVWGTASMQNLQVALGAVLAPQFWQAPAASSSALWRSSPSTPGRSGVSNTSQLSPQANYPLTRSGTREALAARFTRVLTAIDNIDVFDVGIVEQLLVRVVGSEGFCVAAIARARSPLRLAIPATTEFPEARIAAMSAPSAIAAAPKMPQRPI